MDLLANQIRKRTQNKKNKKSLRFSLLMVHFLAVLASAKHAQSSFFWMAD